MNLRQKWISIISFLALNPSLLLHVCEGGARSKSTSGESWLKLKRIKNVNGDNNLNNFPHTLISLCLRHKASNHMLFLKVKKSINLQIFDRLLEASICIDEFNLHSGLHIYGNHEKYYALKKLWLNSGEMYHNALITLLEMRDVKSYLNSSDDIGIGCDCPQDVLFIEADYEEYFYQLVGIIAAQKLTMPLLIEKVMQGALRLGIKNKKILMIYEKIKNNIDYSDGWIQEELIPLLGNKIKNKKAVMLGASIYLDARADYYDALLNITN
ncbi:hypothetical protein [Pantoea sp. SS70]|jgi:hypothetical protein|uniref:hypothetical protein n=1 Tax=Pantoea sp. SS70 TaxID=3024247 RepID=UPI002453139C|nr:hypothetical protein [Pantoea sp. SS70]WGK59837.1 hypothetical protein PO881_21060 [Pantoea sp. SS70]